MPLELLIQAGLTPTQAELLGFLLSQGTLKAKDIVSALNKPRGVVYKALEELVALNLVEKIEKLGAVAAFRAEHPSRLATLFEAKEKQAQKEKKAFLSNLPEITARYNLLRRKPEIHYREGENGLHQLINETLQSQTEILSFLDKNSTEGKFINPATNPDYLEKFRRFGIKQRVLIAGEKPADTLDIVSDDMSQLEIRYLGTAPAPFKSAVTIFDNKLAYQVSEGGQTDVVTIEDKNIYEINKAWFEFLWQLAQ